MIQIVAKTVPAIMTVIGGIGVAAHASYGWPLTLLGAGLFVLSLFV